MRAWAELPIVVAALGFAAAAPAQQNYRPGGFMRSGYSDKVLGRDEWSVRGSAHDQGASVSVALYRAAQLADAAGATELRVTSQKIKSTTVTERNSYRQVSYNEATTLTVRAVRSERDRTACAMPEVAKCLTLTIAGIMATYGPRMAMPAVKPGAVPAAILPLVTTSPYQRVIADLLARRPEMRAPSSSLPRAVPRATIAHPAPPVLSTARAASDTPTAQALYAARLKAAQPVTGGDRAQGWTISD